MDVATLLGLERAMVWGVARDMMDRHHAMYLARFMLALNYLWSTAPNRTESNRMQSDSCCAACWWCWVKSDERNMDNIFSVGGEKQIIGAGYVLVLLSFERE